MPALFKSLAELLEKVEATKKRLEIIEQTANYLKTLDADEIEPATNMLVGKAFLKYSQKKLDVSWSTLIRIFEGITVFDMGQFRLAMASTGDIGQATKTILENSKPKRQTQLTQTYLTIAEVRRAFDAIAQSQGFTFKDQKRTRNYYPDESSHLR